MSIQSKRIMVFESTSQRIGKSDAEQRYLAELEKYGPNGVGATVDDDVTILHWDGSRVSRLRREG